MAVGAIVSLLHDLVVAAGIYSIVGFEVTPSTVVGLLTILGFSLYDTVVVFDKIRENTRDLTAGSRMTYSEAANLAVNQTLMRSINTSLISLLPVAGLLFVGAGILGVGTIKDLALILFVGLASGAYSSLFLAAPIVCDLTERQPAYRALARRVAARRAADAKAGKTDGHRRGRAESAPPGGSRPPRPRRVRALDPPPDRPDGNARPAPPPDRRASGERTAPAAHRPATPGRASRGSSPAACATSRTTPRKVSCSRTSSRCWSTPTRSARPSPPSASS